MDQLKKLLTPIIYILKNHKKTILIGILSIPLFSIVLFPLDDLSGLISSKVTQASNNKVFLQFNKLGIAFFPPSIEFKDVAVDVAELPTVKAKKLFLAPSLAGLLAFKLGFSATGEDVLGGDISVTAKEGKKKDNVQLYDVDLNVKKVDIKKLMALTPLSGDVEGNISLSFSGAFDGTMGKPPESEFDLNSSGINIKSLVFNTMMGPMPINDFKFQKILAQGKLQNSELSFDKAILENKEDGLTVQVVGKIGMQIQNAGGRIFTLPGSYSADVQIVAEEKAAKKYSFYLSTIDTLLGKYKTLTGTGSKYTFRVEAPDITANPTFNASSKSF